MMREHPLYATWWNIRRRCYSPSHYEYHRYGGRGITICDRWLSIDGFWNFVNDMGNKPDGMSLDRRDNDGPYSPENCRWATSHEQQANRRDNRPVVGVHYHQTAGKWRAELMVKGNRYYAYFQEYDDAVKYRKYLERMI